MIHNAGGEHSVLQIKAGRSGERGSALQPLDPSTEARTSTAPAEIGTNLFYEAAS